MTRSTRREFVQVLAPLLTRLAARGAAGPPPVRPKLDVSLAQEFPRSTVTAISPDGKMLCLEDWGVPGYPLRVLESETWRQVYTGRFQSRAQFVGFFADSQTLLVQGLASSGNGVCGVGKGHCVHQKVVVDVRTGERSEKFFPIEPDRGEGYWPLNPGILLDAHYEARPWTTETLALVEYPSLREIAKAPYATGPREPRPRKGEFEQASEFGFGLSDDRRTLAYSFDHTLLCRRAADLQVLWSRQIEPGLRAYRVVLSARGDRVAAAISDSPFAREQHVSYVAIFDGATGGDIAHLPRSGIDGIALSPDGDMIATVTRASGGKGAAVPTAHIYDVLSGQELASVTHDRIKNGRHQLLEAVCDVTFTSDGRYMITSGMATKVWTLGR